MNPKYQGIIPGLGDYSGLVSGWPNATLLLIILAYTGTSREETGSILGQCPVRALMELEWTFYYLNISDSNMNVYFMHHFQAKLLKGVYKHIQTSHTH